MTMMPSTASRTRCSTETSSVAGVTVSRLTELANNPSARAASSMLRWIVLGPK